MYMYILTYIIARSHLCLMNYFLLPLIKGFIADKFVFCFFSKRKTLHDSFTKFVNTGYSIENTFLR